MPIVRPMLAIIALWSFIGPFLDYMLPSILLSDPKQYTLATGLYTLITDVRNMHQPVFAAGGLLDGATDYYPIHRFAESARIWTCQRCSQGLGGHHENRID